MQNVLELHEIFSICYSFYKDIALKDFFQGCIICKKLLIQLDRINTNLMPAEIVE